MSEFGVLAKKDMPFNTYCQAFDCSKVTINFSWETCWPMFVRFNDPTTYGAINLSVDYEDGTVTSTPIQIQSDIITNLTGTVSTVFGSDVLIGSGTLFETEVSDGDYLVVDSYIFRVYSVDSDTQITLTSDALITLNTVYASVIYLSYDILPATLGWTTTTMPEGTYEITLSYYFTPTTTVVTHTDTVLVYCEKYCCVYNKLTDLADLCDDCLDQEEIKKITNALFMWALLESYKGAAGCGDSASMATLQARLDRYCDYQPCTHC